jgi:hypothetical protein
MAVLVALVAIAPGAALAQAYGVAFTTAVTYQNVGDSPAEIVALFYDSPSDTSPIEIDLDPLNPNASTSQYVGGLSQIADGFQGSVVLQSSEPLLATMVQLPQGSATVKNRPLHNGFSEGGSQVLIGTVLKDYYSTTSVFSIQNADSTSTDLTLRFYDTSAVEVYSESQTVEPGAAYYFDAGQAAGLGSTFNGSAVIESTGEAIVGGNMELSTNTGGTACSAFEGVAQGAQKYYMPSALCQAWGANTSYAVQNTNLVDETDVTVTYSNGVTDMKTIGPGAKQSFVACNASGMTAGFSGSAVVESADTDVIAIGKAYGSGLSTAFIGASSGAAKVALPYVRWAKTVDYDAGNGQRTFLTIQNVGDDDLDAGDVTVKYIKFDGVAQGTTHSLPAIPSGGKKNSNASDAGLDEFGIYGSSYGGGAIIECSAPGCELAVVARVSTQVSPGSYASEDYNGMPVE